MVTTQTIKPRVSIGVPVYNGERFLGATLESLLSQSFTNFEIVISDNRSTDKTPEVAKAYALMDRRIRYYRNETNIGAARNFNRVFELASGEYFKWSAHDDICGKEFLSKCVKVLDQDPSLSLCYTQQVDIDERGNVIGPNPYNLNTALESPYARFAEVMKFWRGAPAIWGVARRSVLAKTPLIGNYYASDLVLLAELALYGRFHQVAEDLLFHRDHSGRSVYVCRAQEMVAWLDPAKSTVIGFPTWRWFWEYLRVIYRAPVTWSERARCWLHVVKWLRWRWAYARDDIGFFIRQLLIRFERP